MNLRRLAIIGGLVIAAGIAWLSLQPAVAVADPVALPAEFERRAAESGLHLTEQQAEAMAAGCRDFIAGEVNRALEQSRSSQAKYTRLASAMVLSLDFVINNLTQMAHGHAAADQLRRSAVELETAFLEASVSYDLTLGALSAMIESCATHPAVFRAGLLIAAERRQAVIGAGQSILDFAASDFRDELIRLKAEVAEEN